MATQKLTVGIYGIQDINNSETSTVSHDHSIAIMKNGKVILSTHVERLSRKKHSAEMNMVLYDLLKNQKLFSEECNYIFVDNILGSCFINKTGNIRFEGPINKTLKTTFQKGRFWLLDKPANGYILNHELAHIGSCLPFFGNFKNNSLLIHFDGGASLSNFSVWQFRDQKLESIEYHWDLKWLSSLYNANALVFGIVKAKQEDLNSVPGKFMGFASYGKYSKDIEIWLQRNNFFENIWKSKSPFFKSAKENFNVELKELNQRNPFIQNVAATIQQIFIRETLKKINALQKQTQTDFLYYSGGSALNILLNTTIIEHNIFKDVFIPPCCNDSGLALGAAAFFEWQQNNNIEIHDAFINNWDIEDYTTNSEPSTIKKVADLLIQNKVIGICNNQAETGPRALGNRSIIGLASDKNLSDKISIQHKKREWYRPVAPIMLDHNTKYFTENDQIHHLSKYMLLDFKITKHKQNELKGAIHIDGTSRIQTISSRKENPFMFDLLTYLDKTHKVKALINTSFNTKGEPIVHTIEDALKSAKNMQLDAVVLNGKLIKLK